MKQSLYDIIEDIVKQVDEHPDTPHLESTLRHNLLAKGFNPHDVSIALHYMREHIQENSTSPVTNPGLVRHLSPYECFKLGPEVQAALARLELYKLLTPFERELILERLTQLDGEITIFELDFVLTWVLCGNRNFETVQTIFNVLTQNMEALN